MNTKKATTTKKTSKKSTKQLGRKPGSKNKPKGLTQIPGSLLSVMPNAAKIKLLERMLIKVLTEERAICRNYPDMVELHKHAALTRLRDILLEKEAVKITLRMLKLK